VILYDICIGFLIGMTIFWYLILPNMRLRREARILEKEQEARDRESRVKMMMEGDTAWLDEEAMRRKSEKARERARNIWEDLMSTYNTSHNQEEGTKERAKDILESARLLRGAGVPLTAEEAEEVKWAKKILANSS